MEVVVSPSPFHVVPFSSGEKLLTLLPCCNMMSLPQEIVLHEHLQLVWVPSVGCDPPSHGLLQLSPLSDLWPPLGSISSSSIGSSTGCRQTSLLLIFKGCKGSACHLIVRQRGMSDIPPLLLPHWCQCPHDFLSLVPLLSKTKELPNKRNLPNRCFFLKYVITQALICVALARSRYNLEPEGSFSNLLTEVYATGPLHPYQNSTRNKSNTHQFCWTWCSARTQEALR